MITLLLIPKKIPQKWSYSTVFVLFLSSFTHSSCQRAFINTQDQDRKLDNIGAMIQIFNDLVEESRQIAIVFTQCDCYKDVIQSYGGILNLIQNIIPSVYNAHIHHKENVTILEVAAVAETVEDVLNGEILVRSKINFSSYGLHELMQWLAQKTLIMTDRALKEQKEEEKRKLDEALALEEINAKELERMRQGVEKEKNKKFKRFLMIISAVSVFVLITIMTCYFVYNGSREKEILRLKEIQNIEILRQKEIQNTAKEEKDAADAARKKHEQEKAAADAARKKLEEERKIKESEERLKREAKPSINENSIKITPECTHVGWYDIFNQNKHNIKVNCLLINTNNYEYSSGNIKVTCTLKYKNSIVESLSQNVNIGSGSDTDYGKKTLVFTFYNLPECYEKATTDWKVECIPTLIEDNENTNEVSNE